MAANRQTPPLVGSGSEGEAEDRAQGGGGRPVRGRRAEARAGRGMHLSPQAIRLPERSEPRRGRQGLRGIPRRSSATRIGSGWRGRPHASAQREG